jgi:hypothetical protein
MATLVLIPLFSYLGSAAGSAGVTGGIIGGMSVGGAAAIGGAIGTVAGAALGTYIDQKYVYPMFQPTTNTTGPRIDDLPIQTGSEGSLMHYAVGAENRMAGTVIWLSDLVEVKREESVEGGKGGGGGSKQTTYDYYLSCAVGVCEGPITAIKKIWADSKLIYDADGGLGSGTASGYVVNSFQPVGDENINIDSGTGNFRKGDVVRFGTQTTTYEVSSDFNEGDTTLVIETPGLVDDVHTGDAVTLVQGGDPENTNKDRRVHRIRIYVGDESQVPDSIISAAIGPELTPGFRGLCYVVIDGLQLRDFGNRLPQFSFLVQVQTHESLAGALYNIIHRADIADSEMNLDYVAHSVRGYTTTGPTEIVRQIEPLMQAYTVMTRESNGVLYFFTEGYEHQVTVNPNDLVAQEGEGSAGRPFILQDPSGFSLPREVNVRYIDPSADYQSGNQRYSRTDSFTTHVENLDVPIVMSARDARDMAANRLWRSYSERLQVQFSLPPRYVVLEENDLVNIDYAGEQYTVRLSEVTQGNNFIVECKGVLTGKADADEAIDCARRLNEAEPVTFPLPMTAAVMDSPALQDADSVQAGVYVAASTVLGQPNFTGAALYASADATNWNAVGSVGATSTMGTTSDDYGAGRGTLGPASEGVIDYVSTVDVLLQGGTLESVTPERLLNGANRAWVGAELVGFQTATQLGPMAYRLSGLLRGLRGTATTAHHAGEGFVLVSPVTVGFQPLQGGAIGATRYYKVVQDGQSVDDVPTLTSVYTGNNLKQLPVCHLDAFRDATTHDATLTWKRRTRSLVKAFAPYKPLGADAERYEVDVFAGTDTGAIPLRTVTVTSPTLTYTKAQQDADTGSSSVASFTAVVYQINEQVGRGVPASVVIP